MDGWATTATQNGRRLTSPPVQDAYQPRRLPAAITRDVLQQCEMPRSFDRDRQLPLFARRAMRLAARQNLATLVETHLETLDVLVIDHFIVGEYRLLAPAAATRTTWAGFPIPSIPRWSSRTVPSGALSKARTLRGSILGRLVRLLAIHTRR